MFQGLSNYGKECTKRVARGTCRQPAWVDSEECYYHDKLSKGLLDDSSSVTIIDDDEDF